MLTVIINVGCNFYLYIFALLNVATEESWLENWGVGRDTLMLAGEDYDDSDIVDCDIWEE